MRMCYNKRINANAIVENESHGERVTFEANKRLIARARLQSRSASKNKKKKKDAFQALPLNYIVWGLLCENANYTDIQTHKVEKGGGSSGGGGIRLQTK